MINAIENATWYNDTNTKYIEIWIPKSIMHSNQFEYVALHRGKWYDSIKSLIFFKIKTL